MKFTEHMFYCLFPAEDEISMDEVSDISDYIQNAAGSTAEVI